jgi:serine/threonine protein phosphatase 1
VPLSLAGFQAGRARAGRPSLPTGLRIYAVGDIHGRVDLLSKLLDRIDTDIALRPTPRPVYVFLGDYIDRGSSSRETVDLLIEHGEKYESIFLKGNHELIAIKCLTDPNLLDSWMRLGGLDTLKSYGVAFKGLASVRQIVELQVAFHMAIPQAHFRFFRCLQSSFACGDFFFAHAGVKPNVDLSQQKESDLLWIREEFLSSKDDFGKIVVHGHTPTSEIEVRPNRINIDTGAFATGRLTCLVIENESLSVIDTSFNV